MHTMLYDDIYLSSVFFVVIFFTLIPFITLKWVVTLNSLLLIMFYLSLSFFTDYVTWDVVKYTALFCSVIIVTILVFYNKQQLERNSFIINKSVSDKNFQLSDSIQQISDQKDIIEKSYSKINESIEYAKRIQNSMLASNTVFDTIFNDVSLLYLPKETVGGDFYMARQKSNLYYVAVADCTGHGVPGALVSGLGTQELSHIIENNDCPVSEMLAKLNDNLNKLLNNDNQIGSDGMDLTLLCIDKEKKTIEYSGAKGIFYMYQNDELIHMKTDRVSIGQNYSNDFAFTTNTLTYNSGDSLHLLSDGLLDQTSQVNQKRIGSKRVKELLTTLSKLNKDEKQKQISSFLNTHKSGYQTDDITLLTLKLC